MLDQCMIFPEAGCHAALFSETLSTFAAMVDDRGDVWMGVERKGGDGPFLLWVSKAEDAFSINRGVRHEAVRRGVCLARRRDAMLVLDGRRLSLVPFAALRGLPAAF